MIARIRGELARKNWPEIVVDVGGVGYLLHVPLGTYERLPPEGRPVTLEVLTTFRNESLQLYGFGSPDEKRLFGALLAVNGIGPRLALAVLSKLSPVQLVSAVLEDRSRLLESVPGIGRKTAQRLVLELKDRLDDTARALVASGAPQADPRAGDGVTALENLGYRRELAERTVSEVLAEGFDGDLAELIRVSLRRLGGRG